MPPRADEPAATKILVAYREIIDRLDRLMSCVKYVPTLRDNKDRLRFQQQRDLIAKIKKDTANLTEKKAKKK